MAMTMAMAMAAALLVLLVAAPAVQAVQHTVGDSNGWSQNTDLATWSAGQTFTVGDTLLFNYGGSHGVDVVSQSDYNNCNTGNSINSYSSSPTTVTLDKAGSMYFVCPSFGHCQGGMKLAVTVGAAGTTTPSSGTPPATTTTSPPSSSSSPATPTTTPATTTTTTPHPYSRAAGGFGSMNLGFSMGLAALVAFMG